MFMSQTLAHYSGGNGSRKGSKIHGGEWLTKHSINVTSKCFVNDLLREFCCPSGSVSGLYPCVKKIKYGSLKTL